MPRTKIEIPETIEYLSILDDQGNLDQELDPKISDELLLDLYQSMLLGRRFDERMVDLQRQGRIGTFPPIKGQEASQIGSVFQLTPDDWFVPAFRETAAEIWRGRSLESILLYYNGFNEGATLEKEKKDLPIAIPVSSQILHAVGLGCAANYKKTGEIVMVFFGDGATSEGDFHEGLNCAAVYNTPVVFICQNNHWAISVPVKQQTRSNTIAQKALSYGMPGIQVDGNDILAVYAATKEAAEKNITATVYWHSWKELPHSIIAGQENGLTQLIVSADDNRILGAVIVGPGSTERITEAALAIEMGALIEDLSLTLRPHPGFSELLSKKS